MQLNSRTPDARRALGLVLVVISALSFAAGSSSAVFSYHAGATPSSVVTARIMFTIVALYLFIRATGGKTRLPPADRNRALLLGLLMAAQSYSLMKAIDLVPVAVAVLAFYLYPLMIGIGVHATGQERITPGLAIGLVGAFIGLVLVLDVTGGGLDPLGIGLAVLSALTFAVVAVTMQPMIARAGDSRPITLHMHYTSLLVFVVVDLALGDFPLPTGTGGWIAFAAVPVFYAIAITTFFIAFGMIGPVRSSLIMNLEPIAAIVFSFALLGQVLSLTQLAGAAIVIAAITAVRLDNARRTAKT